MIFYQVLLVAKRSIPLAIVAYTLTISVGKIFAGKHNYNIDPNQELLALGVTNLIGSTFWCLPSAASLSRSAVQESAGGRTQLVSIINCVGILFVLYFAGSLLEKLPICILAAIIAIALKGLIWQFKDFVRYWKVSLSMSHCIDQFRLSDISYQTLENWGYFYEDLEQLCSSGCIDVELWQQFQGFDPFN